jgi:hypothetical protein
MAFAFVANSVRIYPVETNTTLRQCFEQVLEFNLTALASDTAFNLATAAAADSTNGPAIVSLLSKVSRLTGAFILESPRDVSASGAAHVMSGTSVAPVFTFTGTASTPTALTFSLRFKLSKDETPMIVNPV